MLCLHTGAIDITLFPKSLSVLSADWFVVGKATASIGSLSSAVGVYTKNGLVYVRNSLLNNII